jgi:hypothetical protein
MRWLDLVTVGTTPTDSGIQRRKRSSLTSHSAAAGMQPHSSARGVDDACSSRALIAYASATEV